MSPQLAESGLIDAMTWIVGIKERGGGGDRAVEGGGAQGQRGLKEEVGTDVEVMQVLRKLQAPQVKRLHIETRILSSGGGAAEPRCGVNEQ